MRCGLASTLPLIASLLCSGGAKRASGWTRALALALARALQVLVWDGQVLEGGQRE